MKILLLKNLGGSIIQQQIKVVNFDDGKDANKSTLTPTVMFKVLLYNCSNQQNKTKKKEERDRVGPHGCTPATFTRPPRRDMHHMFIHSAHIGFTSWNPHHPELQEPPYQLTA